MMIMVVVAVQDVYVHPHSYASRTHHPSIHLHITHITHPYTYTSPIHLSHHTQACPLQETLLLYYHQQMQHHNQ